MYVYYLNAMVSALLIRLGFDINSKVIRFIIIIVAISIPCILAGFRDISVGTDVALYGYPIYSQARRFTLDLYSNINPSFTSVFNLFSWSIANLSPTRQIFLSFIQALSIIPVVYSLSICYANKASLGYFIYLVVFFPMTLNMIRQGVSIGFVTAAYIFMSCDKRFSYILCLIFATLFHSSAVVAFASLPFLFFESKKRKSDMLIMIVCLAGISIFLYGYPLLTEIISSFVGSYDQYLDSDQLNLFGSSIFTSLAFALIILYCAYMYSKNKIDNSKIKNFIELVVLGTITYLLAVRSATLYRIALYFLVSIIPLVLLNVIVEINKSSLYKLKIVDSLPIIVWSLLFSWIYYEVLGLQQVVPYLIALT